MFIMMKNFAKFFILINLIYFLLEKEVLVLVNEDKHRTNYRRCFLFISFDTVISPNCLYELPLLLMKNVKTLYTLYSQRKLNLSGDVEKKPGPQVNFKALTNLFRVNNKYLKFFHVSAQSLIKKRWTLEDITKDLGTNTIYAISETWLKETDDLKLWENNSKNFKTFRADRDTPTQECGGGVILRFPSSLNPKLLNDLNYMNEKNFESLWIECSVNNNSPNKQKQLINVSYNPNKSQYHQFLEELSISIDHAIVENKPLTIMGGYNINYLNTREKQDLETVTLPYGLIVSNTDQPTRKKGTSKTLIDYIITDHSNAAYFTPIVSDTPLRTIGKKPIDHLATCVITMCDSNDKIIQCF